MKTKKITIKAGMDIPVSIESNENGEYRVKYGAENTGWTDYNRAADHLGHCIMHSALCKGSLDDID